MIFNNPVYLLISPTFFPDPREQIVPYRYVVKKRLRYQVRREQWVENKWIFRPIGDSFDNLHDAVKQYQKNMERVIKSWKDCQYDKAKIECTDFSFKT